MVAVGTRVTSRPPPRSVRADFPHTAPTSGVTAVSAVCAPAPVSRLFGSESGTCCAVRIPLGLGPSLHQLRHGALRFVRWLHRYYGLARLPAPCIIGYG